MSVWRAVRDEGYIPWLKSLGLKMVQLTLFGGREMTDRYTGSRGGYDETLSAIELLLAAGIAPRIQIFVNKETLGELQQIADLIASLRLTERCAALGAPVRPSFTRGAATAKTPSSMRCAPRRMTLTKSPSRSRRARCGTSKGAGLARSLAKASARWPKPSGTARNAPRSRPPGRPSSSIRTSTSTQTSAPRRRTGGWAA
ncbi:MAG: hypothetical protein LBD02_10160 [Christensenellaceae bacterium]|nr:hypothetical protein [Christensenellaceae bacterium]